MTAAGRGRSHGWTLPAMAWLFAAIAASVCHDARPARAQAVAPSTTAAPARSGQTVCIQCNGPDASYACHVTDTSAGAGDAGIRLYCITEIARTRHHASCAAARVTTTPCAGEQVVLAAGGGASAVPRPATDGSAAEGNPSSADGGTVAPPPGTMVSDDPQLGPPPTDAAEAPRETPDNSGTDDTAETAPSGVEKAVSSAGKALNSAGQAVSNTAKKSWSCVTSFFSDC